MPVLCNYWWRWRSSSVNDKLKDFSFPGLLPCYFTTLYAVCILYTRGIIKSNQRQFAFILNILDIWKFILHFVLKLKYISTFIRHQRLLTIDWPAQKSEVTSLYISFIRKLDLGHWLDASDSSKLWKTTNVMPRFKGTLPFPPIEIIPGQSVTIR